MKNKMIAMGMLILMGMTACGVSFAAPERLEIKSQKSREKLKQGKAFAKTADLSRIQDPEVRLALKAVFDVLQLDAKKG